MARRSAVVAVALCSVAVGCGSGPHGIGAAARVRLVSASPTLIAQCLAAARSLGFPVPCPGRVPTDDGQRLGCSPLPGPTPLAPCLGPQRDFFIEWNGFDVPPHFSGVDGKAVGHVILHAALARQSPPMPCIDGVAIGMIRVTDSLATLYRCPPDSARIERLAQHGEGAYAGHLTLAWQGHGVDYLISSHGYSLSSRALLQDLGASINISAP